MYCDINVTNYRLWLQNIILRLGFVDFMTKVLKKIDFVVTFLSTINAL